MYVFARGNFVGKNAIFAVFTSLMFINMGTITIYPKFEILSLVNAKITSFVGLNAYCSTLDLSGSSITSIARQEFSRHQNLKTVNLSNCKNLTIIEFGAFQDSLELITVNLSGCTNLTTIEDWAFAGCSQLSTLDTTGCTITTIGDNVFNGCTSLTTD